MFKNLLGCVFNWLCGDVLLRFDLFFLILNLSEFLNVLIFVLYFRKMEC